MTTCPVRPAHGSISAIGPRETRLNCTWLLSTTPPRSTSDALPAAQRVVRDAHLVDDPDVAQRAHPPHRGAVADHRVGPVHLVQVDRAHAEPLRARDPALLHDRGRRHHREHLRRDHDVVRAARRAQRVAQDPLAAPEAVDLGGVEHRDPQLAGPPDDPAGLGVVVPAAVAPLLGPELPGAQTDHRVRLRGRDAVDVAHASGLHRSGARRRNATKGTRRRPLIDLQGTVNPVQRADGLPVDAT